MKFTRFCFLFGFLMLYQLSLAQEITNIHFEQVGKKIHIYYDLHGDKSYTVKVFCSTENGGSWGSPLRKVNGAIGESQKPASNKMIIWDVLAEREKLTGEIRFKIDAIRGIDIDMVYVSGGTFLMGSYDGENDEQPIHTVSLSSFQISKYEITNEQYCIFLNVISCNSSGSFTDPEYGLVEYIDMDDGDCQINYSGGEFIPESGQDDFPVIEVSWYGANAYANWAEGSLPTEAEWEFAARGGNQSNGFTYSGRNNIDDVAWYSSNSGRHTHEVGTKAPNELGIYDMSGNVWEWCKDWYDANYYSISPENNPPGSSSGTYCVLRGGSWNNNTNDCRVALRVRLNPGSTNLFNGFRIVH